MVTFKTETNVTAFGLAIGAWWVSFRIKYGYAQRNKVETKNEYYYGNNCVNMDTSRGWIVTGGWSTSEGCLTGCGSQKFILVS